ncbi:MAG: WD40 repeat domain-containing protein, partial [Planctomycetes bacterium]|nr:WD40 repeat domain-containing protein [Planctomycetota bacterium]
TQESQTMAPADPKALEAKYKPKQFKVLPLNQQLCSIRLSPDGKLLVAGTFEGGLRRWDFSTDQFTELTPLAGHNGWVQSIAFHTDGKRLFSCDSWGRLSAWPIAEKDAKPLWSIADAHDGWIHAIALSPDGTKLASAGRDKTVRISSTADGKKIAVFPHTEDVLSVAFHPDGKSLVSGDHKGIIRQWDLATGKATREFDAKTMYMLDRIQDVGGVRCFLFDKAGSILIAGGAIPTSGGFVTATSVILVYDWATGKVKHTIKSADDKQGYVLDMAFHPDGFLMAVSSGQPGTGRLFFQNLEDPQAFFSQPLANCHALALQPGGRLIVSATNANSAGNGRPGKGKEDYPGNFSPLHVFDFPAPKK